MLFCRAKSRVDFACAVRGTDMELIEDAFCREFLFFWLLFIVGRISLFITAILE